MNLSHHHYTNLSLILFFLYESPFSLAASFWLSFFVVFLLVVIFGISGCYFFYKYKKKMSNNNSNIENPYQTLYENLIKSHKFVTKTLENMSYIMKQSSSPSLSSTPSSSLLSSSLLTSSLSSLPSSSSSSSSSSSPTKVNNIMPIPIRTTFTSTLISAFASTSTSTSISTSTSTLALTSASTSTFMSTFVPILTPTPTPTSTSMSSRHSSFSMSPLPSRLYTSGNTLLSKENVNWIVLYGSTSSTMAACFACRYYGHLAIDYLNIKEEYRSTCFKCEGEHHTTECISKSRVNILKDDFIQPDQIITIMLTRNV